MIAKIKTQHLIGLSFIICHLSFSAALLSCSELKDDSHYKESDSPISNAELKIVDQSSESYMQSRSSARCLL